MTVYVLTENNHFIGVFSSYENAKNKADNLNYKDFPQSSIMIEEHLIDKGFVLRVKI